MASRFEGRSVIGFKIGQHEITGNRSRLTRSSSRGTHADASAICTSEALPGLQAPTAREPDDRTKSHLDIVLEEVCRSLPHGGDHARRGGIADKLLDSAREGNTTLAGLTEVVCAALAEEIRLAE